MIVYASFRKMFDVMNFDNICCILGVVGIVGGVTLIFIQSNLFVFDDV